MKKSRVLVFLVTVLLLCVAVLCGLQSRQLLVEAPAEDTAEFWFLAQIDGEPEVLHPWMDEYGVYHVFLPGDVQPDHLTAQLSAGASVELAGVSLEYGAGCDGFRMEEPLSLNYRNRRETYSGTLVFHNGAQLPSIHIDVQSGSMHYIHKLKGNEEKGTMRLYSALGELEYEGNLEAMEGRGNATWNWEKKSYDLKLVRQENLLGMGTANNWVLLSNVYDPTHLRNKIVFDTAEQTGLEYSPAARWVELYLNGDYAGLYLLSEKNEIHSERIGISESHGSLISIEKEDRLWEYGRNQFISDNGIPIRIRADGGNPNALTEKIRSLETALLSADGADPVSGNHWTDLIDLDSWAKKYLIEEVFGNLDAGAISQFFYWDDSVDGKIYAGPVWDYDVSMGNPAAWQLEVPQMLFAGREHLWSEVDISWFYALTQKDLFRERVTQLYETTFRPVLTQLLQAGIPDYELYVSDAARRNQLRWGSEDPGALTAEMLRYMTDRIAFLDSLWLEEETYHRVLVYIREHVMACYMIPDGAYFPEMEVPDGTDTIIYEAWCDKDTDEAFDFSKPVTKDKLIYLRQTNLLEKNIGAEQGLSLSAIIRYVPLAALLGLLVLVLTAEWIRQKKAMAPSTDNRYPARGQGRGK